MAGFKTILPAHGSRNDPPRPDASPSSQQSHTSGPSVIDDPLNYEPAKPKRKRTVQGKVAIIACLECRRTRSKCDAEPPNACARCIGRSVRCIYQPHTKIQKDEILSDLEQERTRVESLTQRNHELSTILQAISSSGGHLEEVIQRLQQKEDTKSIADWLSSCPNMQGVLRRNSSELVDMEDAVGNLGRIYNMHLTDPLVDNLSRTKWTDVTGNIKFVDYLVRLYLIHVHPRCMLFDELTFMQAYRSGDGTSCSRALLNAICAMACNTLSRRPLEDERDISYLAHIQEAFFVEAKSSITSADLQDVMAAQAMAIMYLTDLSRGKALSANAYLKCASEYLRNFELEEEMRADLDLSRWGIHCLEVISCALTHQSLFCPQTFNKTIIFDSSEEFFQQLSESTETLFDGCTEMYTLSIQTAGIKARLCQLVYEMIGLYSGSTGSLTLDAILSFSKSYVYLLEQSSQALVQTSKLQFRSDIRAVHIESHALSAKLWSPLVFLAKAQHDETMLDQCRTKLMESARKGLCLARDALEDSDCEFLLPQCTMCILYVCDSVARWTTNSEERLEAIHTCFEILNQNTTNFKLCSMLRKLFRNELAKFVEPEVIEAIQKKYEIHATATVDEALDATTRLTYVTNIPGISQWLGGKIQWHEARVWVSSSASPSSSRSPTSGTSAMRVEDMCN